MPETFWSTTEVVGESIDQSQQDISSSSSIQKDPAMVRRDSEWVFEKFLRETTNGSSSPAILEGSGEEEESDVVEMMMDDCNVRKKSRRIVVEGDSHSLPGKSCVPDPEFLKKQLDLACAAAAVAFCRKNVQELSPPFPSAEVVTITGSEMASQAPVNGSAFGVQKMLKNDIHGNVGSSRSALSKAQNSVGQPQTKPLTSSSSREQTDEDELLSGVETVENLDPADAKRVKRMISNRESARRSRRRKQAHLSELETQVSQLKGENSSLIEKLSDLSKKYHGACVNSRILKADVETMRAKVKMAEDMVKRVTGVAVGASPRWVGGITKLWNNAVNESVEVSKKCVEVESPPLNGIDASNWNNIKCSISK